MEGLVTCETALPLYFWGTTRNLPSVFYLYFGKDWFKSWTMWCAIVIKFLNIPPNILPHNLRLREWKYLIFWLVNWRKTTFPSPFEDFGYGVGFHQTETWMEFVGGGGRLISRLKGLMILQFGLSPCSWIWGNSIQNPSNLSLETPITLILFVTHNVLNDIRC